jgi:hypothetical protein
MGTVAAELVSSLRAAAAACNVTPIVVGDGLRAAGCSTAVDAAANKRGGDSNYAGRRLRGPGTATEPEIVESGASLT